MVEPLRIWAVSDGRAGMESQALGLAEAVARLAPAAIEVKRIAWRPGFGRLPTRLNLAPIQALSPASDAFAAPWPDLWIATGRASLALSIRVRGWSGGKSFVVQTQAPRLPSRLFDLVVPPRHDALDGANVFPILGSPNRLTPQRLAAERARFEARLSGLPRPRVAVLVGGRSKAFDLTPERAEMIAAELSIALDRAGASLLMTFSRRTPEPARKAFAERLGGQRGWIWDATGENPYFAFLEAADAIVVTEDSTNMAAEAATTGKPVFVLRMEGASPRMKLFHQALQAHGATRPFAGTFETWAYEPLRETDRAAAEILRRMGRA